jgi:hypothetical protein
MFIRFVVGRDDEHHRLLKGVITEAELLRDDALLERYQVSMLDATYDWLNEHLPCPPFRKGVFPRSAVCWFKDNAGEPIKKVWEIVALLKEQGVPVRLLKSRNPGRILYQDEYQVVVEEWKQI